MKKTRTPEDYQAEIEELKAQLEEAQEALRAIRENEVDALVVSGIQGPQVFTLQGADQPYRVFIECMNEGAVTMSPDGTILHCNSRFADMLGKPLESIMGTSFFGLLAGNEGRKLQGMVQSCDMEGCKGEFFLGADHTSVPVQLSARPLNREMDTFCVVVTDLTELAGAKEALRKANEELEMRVDERTRELAESREWYRTTVASIGDAVIVSDAAGRISFMNAVAENLTGWALDEVMGVPVGEVFRVINEFTREKVESPVTKVLREGVIVGLANHTVLIRKDGTEVPIDDSGAPIRSEGGAFTGVVLIFRDISERRQAEEILRRSRDELEFRVQERTAELREAHESLTNERQRLFDVLETLPVMVCLLTPDYDVPFANRAFRAQFGEGRDRKCFDYCFGRKEPCEFCESFKVLQTGQPHHWEVNTPDGHVIDAYDFPFTDADGSQLILEMDIDITDHRMAEAEIKTSSEELRRAYGKLTKEMAEREQLEEHLRQAQKMEALGTLTGGIAHDFNNILAAILGFAEMSLDDVPRDSLLEKNQRNILKSSLRARDLIKQMLTFSRKSEYEIRPMPLMPLIKETASLLRASIPTTIKIDVDTSATSDVVEANATGIQQILMNLATNAAHAMRETGGKLNITLSDAEISSEPDYAGLLPGPYVRLTVSDTGTGMEETVRKRIFDPFFTTKTPGEGTGMGLSVAYGIVKNLKGEITVKSVPGEGSTFEILIPKVSAGEEEAAISAGELPRGKERVLFIDDEEVLVELGEAILEKLGYRAIALTDSTEALKIFSEDPSAFDLIITDQTMPDLTGVRLAKEALKLRPDIPIILCTGFSESINLDTIKAAGIRDLLMKPLARRELGEAVRKVLDAKQEG